MAEDARQQFVVDNKWKRLDWKRRWAANLVGEQTARRIGRPITLAQSLFFSSLTTAGRANRSSIRQYKNAYAGERCVIVGNGPSLRKTDMSLLRDEYTFGLNRIYLMFDEMGFKTSFHVVVNRYVVEQYAAELREITAPLFTTQESRPFLENAPRAVFLNSIVGPWFSPDASLGIWQGNTVTYVAMELAYYMGFSEVILVGVDHRFATIGTPNQLVKATGADLSHFDPRYFADGFKWQLPDLQSSEVAYRLARKAFEKAGRRIIDSTIDGALQVFPKMPLEEALAR